MPTITLNYPSNIPGLPGHHWANAISMAIVVFSLLLIALTMYVEKKFGGKEE